MTTYLDPSVSLDRVKQLAGIDPLNFDRDVYTSEILELTAGIVKSEVVGVSDVTHYRVFYVAAKLLEQDLDAQAVSEADRVKFTLQAKPIESFLQMQAAYDLKYNLVIPDGFAALIDNAPMPVMSIFTA